MAGQPRRAVTSVGAAGMITPFRYDNIEKLIELEDGMGLGACQDLGPDVTLL